jgi:hypothetical protein
MPRPSHPPSSNHPNSICWRAQITQFFSSLLSLCPSQVQICASVTCSQKPSICVLPLIWETRIHTHTKQVNLLLYILTFTYYVKVKKVKWSRYTPWRCLGWEEV